jgi:hypothetical protein
MIEGATAYVTQVTLPLLSSLQTMGGTASLVLGPIGSGFVRFVCHQGSLVCILTLSPAAAACHRIPAGECRRVIGQRSALDLVRPTRVREMRPAERATAKASRHE